MTIKFLRGNTAQNDAYTGALGTFTIDTQRRTLRIHDGTTAGGHELAKVGDLAVFIHENMIGASNGVAPLGADAKVPATYLPSYVDDVLEFANQAAFPTTGETGKIYVALDTNRQYRWGGSSYIELVASPGTTDDVAEGVGNLYFTELRVLETELDGFDDSVAATVQDGDTILEALGKLQAQIMGIDPDVGVKTIGVTAPLTKSGTDSDPIIGINNATTSTAGAMSSADKAKLDSLVKATQVNAEGGTNDVQYMTPLKTKQFLEAGNWEIDLGVLP